MYHRGKFERLAGVNAVPAQDKESPVKKGGKLTIMIIRYLLEGVTSKMASREAGACGGRRVILSLSREEKSNWTRKKSVELTKERGQNDSWGKKRIKRTDPPQIGVYTRKGD